VRLESVRKKIAAAAAKGQQRPFAAPVRPTAEARAPDSEMRAFREDSTLAELLRRHDATRDMYQDLLKRRENARVSMELDAAHRGLTLRIQEGAELPLIPTGLRLMHLTMIGLAIAVAVPLALLFALVRFDPRVRSAQQIERAALVPVLVSIPYAPVSRARSRDRMRRVFAVGMVASVLAVYAAYFVMRLKSQS
jgi:hypothetical protein